MARRIGASGGTAPARLWLSRPSIPGEFRNQRNLGAGVTSASLIELLLLFAEVWVELFFAGRSRVCPVTPFSIHSVVVALGVGIENRTGLAYKIGEPPTTSDIFQWLWRSWSVGGIRRERWETFAAMFLSCTLVLNGAYDEPCSMVGALAIAPIERCAALVWGIGVGIRCLFRIKCAVECSQTRDERTNNR
jgi:hypothetical protein